MQYASGIEAPSWKDEVRRAHRLALSGAVLEALAVLDDLAERDAEISDRALLANDIGVLHASHGDVAAALDALNRALELDPHCDQAVRNKRVLLDETDCRSRKSDDRTTRLPRSNSTATRVAFVSLLFNWPSTGGGTVHTYEAAKFLQQAGFEVRHFYAVQEDWRVGLVTEPLAVESVPLKFSAQDWHADAIRERFRNAVAGFAPDYVIVTDSWNTKPLLAEAVSEFPYFLRIAALECLCPLNNVRMLVGTAGEVEQCSNDQLSGPEACFECVLKRQHQSGSLHQAERALAGFDRRDYPGRLTLAVKNAAGILAVNPTIAAAFQAVTDRVYVVPSGFDPNRFSAPALPRSRQNPPAKRQIFFAGLVEEYMKGFSVLVDAGARLWSQRQDFEIVATADPPGQRNPFVRFIGWRSQADLPGAIAEADILAFPTLAQEALGRSAVEAMACGRPVVASRLGGLPWVIEDEKTGLIFEPGDAEDLARQLGRLLDDPALCDRLGQAGRAKFEREFTWDRIIERHYLPLLGAVRK